VFPLMSGLWTPPTGVALLKLRATEKTLTLPSGERAKVTVDDSGTVEHTETDERLDVKVSPEKITMKVPPHLRETFLEMARLQGVKVNVRR
jgi:hypothetical protein